MKKSVAQALQQFEEKKKNYSDFVQTHMFQAHNLREYACGLLSMGWSTKEQVVRITKDDCYIKLDDLSALEKVYCELQEAQEEYKERVKK